MPVIHPVPRTRLRSVVAYPLSLLPIGMTMVIATVIAVGSALHLLPRAGDSPLAAVEGLVVALAAVLAFLAYKRWVEQAPPREFAATGAVPELAAGLAFGLALFACAVALVSALGGLEIFGVRGMGQLWPMLGIAMTSGVIEEIVFRGLMLRLLERLVGTWLALGATAAFFGLAHLGNAGATWFSALAIMLEAGIMLGAAFLLTRRLWLAIGIHAGWNFTQGWIFSVPVSGSPPPRGLLVTRVHGSEWLTGGAFGLEASIVAMLVATLAGMVLLRLAVRADGFVAPRWRRHGSSTSDGTRTGPATAMAAPPQPEASRDDLRRP